MRESGLHRVTPLKWFFPEVTLPTSLFMSALSTQAFGSAKRQLVHRRAAILILRSLIQQASASRNWSVVLTPPNTNTPFSFKVPAASTLPAQLLVPGEAWDEFRDIWTIDAEAHLVHDCYCWQ